jgi:hypothetical protein
MLTALSPVLLFLSVFLGVLALAYAGASLYRRYKEAKWEASCVEMDAEPPTEEEKAIGDEWKLPAIPEGVDVSFMCEEEEEDRYSDEDEAFFQQAKARAEVAKAEIDKEKQLKAPFILRPPTLPSGAIDYASIPDGKDFIDADGLRYYFAAPTNGAAAGSRRKVRSYRSYKGDGPEPKPMPKASEMARLTAAESVKNVMWVGPSMPSAHADFIPRLVQQILNNEADLLDFYRKMPAKELALHIREANVAGRERVEKIKKRLEADEGAIRRAAEAQVKALHAKSYDELEKTKPVTEKLELEIRTCSPKASTYDDLIKEVEADVKDYLGRPGDCLVEASPDCERQEASVDDLASEYSKLSDAEVAARLKAISKALRVVDDPKLQAVKDKYLTVGEQVGSDDPKLNYYRDPFWFQMQQQQIQKEAMAQVTQKKPKKKSKKRARRK